MEKNSLSINELKAASFSLKTNKSPGYDDINFNVVKKCFGEINEPLKHLFNLSLENGIFPENMKIVKVIPLFKNGDPENITSYRPISVLPCFSKMLERKMYNSLYKYLCEEKLLYSKQSGFQKMSISLIKSTSPLKMIITHSEYSYRRSFNIAKKSRNVRCQYHESNLVCQLLKW